MDAALKTKKDEKQTNEPPKKRFIRLHKEEDEVEIKKLDFSDVKDVCRVMSKCAFDVTEQEVNSIVKYGLSYGCYVNRMLIGVGLAWPADLDLQTKKVKTSLGNSLYLEDPAVLLAYEGRGIRSILMKARENAAREAGFRYSIAYLSEDLPKGEVVSYIKEAGSQLEKIYLSENYEFFRTDKGILAVKKLS